MIVSNLAMVDKIKIKTTATILAQEGIEIVYNIRDANNDKWLPRDCVITSDLYDINQEDLMLGDNICSSYFASGTKTDVAFQFARDKEHYLHTKETTLSHNFIEDFTNNRLYFFTGELAEIEMFRYSHKENNPPLGSDASPYARYITFHQIVSQDSTLPTDKIIKVESHVLTIRAGQTGEVVLESFIANY